jgi:hypothetical protein
MIRFGENTKYAITDNFSYKISETIWDNVLMDDIKNVKINLKDNVDISVWDNVWDTMDAIEWAEYLND